MNDDPLWIRFEQKHDRFVDLMKTREFVDAAHLMETAANEFESAGSSELAASAISMAGSAYSCARMDDEALGARLAAADLQPNDPLHQLSLGRHYLDILDDPAAALPPIERAVVLASNDPTTFYCLSEALGLQGTAWLRLGKTAEAIRRLERTCASASSGPMKPLVDLRLASEFVKRGERLDDCARLVENALEWARLTKNDDLRARAEHLQNTIRKRRA